MAVAMTAVILVAALSGIVTLQKSYAATEQYGIGMADETRLLDYLALDLRRAMTISTTTAPWTMDPDGQGLQINVPDYYHFNPSDPQHLFPVANDPVYDAGHRHGLLQQHRRGGQRRRGAAAPGHRLPVQQRRSITRSDPWQPLVSNGFGGYVAAGPVTIAASMDAFPTITADPTDSSGGTVRYNVTFHSVFQPLATANSSNAITLHNVTFVRSKNLTR